MPVMTKSPKGEELVILSRKEYDELIEDRIDVATLRRLQSDRKAGRAELLSSKEVDELLAAKTPLTFWRKKRGLSQIALAKLTGLSQGFLSEIETGVKTGDIRTLASLAKILSISIDDLVSAPDTRPQRRKSGSKA